MRMNESSRPPRSRKGRDPFRPEARKGEGPFLSGVRRISSRSHPWLKRCSRVREGRERNLLFVEGKRLVEEALEAGLRIEALLVDPGGIGPGDGALIERIERTVPGERIRFVDREVLKTASALKTPPGWLALCIPREAERDPEILRERKGGVLVLAGLRDPGNLGAVLRTAEAAGVDLAIACEGSADPFHPKVLRGAAGSVFRLPILRRFPLGDLIDFTGRCGLRLFALDARKGVDYRDPSLFEGGPPAFVVGSEAAGIPEALRAGCRGVRIPMSGKVESLNAAVAAALLMYEYRRWRERE